MRDILLSQEEFKISTSINSNRRIKFSEDFQDIEFDKFIVAGGDLLLKKDGKTLGRLSFFKDHLEGKDVRGGQMVLTPLDQNKDKFIQFFKPQHMVEPLVKQNEISLEGKSAIVCDRKQLKFDGYFTVDPKRDKLAEVYDELFAKGYTYVFNINSDRVTTAVLPILETLSEQYLNGGSIGSVQSCSLGPSGEPDEIAYENDDWRCYSIDVSTWAKIKSKVLGSSNNFTHSLEEAFSEYRLKRISTCLSRDLFSTPQDSRRKNFNMKESSNV